MFSNLLVSGQQFPVSLLAVHTVLGKRGGGNTYFKNHLVVWNLCFKSISEKLSYQIKVILLMLRIRKQGKNENGDWKGHYSKHIHIHTPAHAHTHTPLPPPLWGKLLGPGILQPEERDVKRTVIYWSILLLGKVWPSMYVLMEEHMTPVRCTAGQWSSGNLLWNGCEVTP